MKKGVEMIREESPVWQTKEIMLMKKGTKKKRGESKKTTR
jgi:hypothetical protein